MISRTTDPNLSLAQLQQIVLDTEKIGYQLHSLVGATYQGVAFNHLTFDVAPKLPNTGPYTQLIVLSPGVTDAAKDPQVTAALGANGQIIFVSSAYVAGNIAQVAAIR